MSWYGDRISESSFRRYSRDVEDAIEACSTEEDIRKLSQMYEFIERESDDFITEAALEQASYIAQGMYIRSSQAQDAAADAFCKDALGLKSAPVRNVEFDALSLMRKAYDAAKSADDGARAEAFARSVADGVASSCIGIANDRMSENVAYSGRSEYVRYAHVPTSSKVCGFCCMVSSSDFVYKNPKRPSLHEGCRCLIVPGLKNKTVLGGYEPDVYRKGYELLVKRGKHGEIIRDADGIPVFKSGLVFDTQIGKTTNVRKLVSGVNITVVKLDKKPGGSIDYSANPIEAFGTFINENVDDIYDPDNFRTKKTEYRDLFAHNVLKDHGFRVRIRPPSATDHNGTQIDNVSNPDIEIDGVLWEIKSPNGYSKRTVENQLRKAISNNFSNPYDIDLKVGMGSGIPARVVFNMRYMNADLESVQREIEYRFSTMDVVELMLITSDGSIFLYKK